MRKCFLALLTVVCSAGLSWQAPAAEADAGRARVNALADRFIPEYRVKYPISYAFSGLPIDRHDGIDINAPADIAQWHALLKGMTAELESVKPDSFADQPEWVTWQFLRHALRDDAATEICHREL